MSNVAKTRLLVVSGLVLALAMGMHSPGGRPALAEPADMSPGGTRTPFKGLLPDNVPPKIRSFTAVPSNGVAPLLVKFSVEASDQDGSIQSVEWNFGNGTAVQTTALSIDHVYMTAGTFTATVVVRDNRGESAAAQTTVTVPAARSPAQQLSALIGRVRKSNVPESSNVLLGAMRQLMEQRPALACGKLDAFVKDIQAQSGKRVVVSEAKELVSSASQIMQSMRCQ
jgi:PKD repeat protein